MSGMLIKRAVYREVQKKKKTFRTKWRDVVKKDVEKLENNVTLEMAYDRKKMEGVSDDSIESKQPVKLKKRKRRETICYKVLSDF